MTARQLEKLKAREIIYSDDLVSAVPLYSGGD